MLQKGAIALSVAITSAIDKTRRIRVGHATPLISHRLPFSDILRLRHLLRY
jgi:hypothetical protein